MQQYILVWKNIRVFQVDYLLSWKFFDGFLLYFLSLDGIEVIQSSGGPGWAVGDAVIISLDGHILQIFWLRGNTHLTFYITHAADNQKFLINIWRKVHNQGLRPLLNDYVESLDSGASQFQVAKKVGMKSYTDSFMSKLSHKLLDFIMW